MLCRMCFSKVWNHLREYEFHGSDHFAIGLSVPTGFLFLRIMGPLVAQLNVVLGRDTFQDRDFFVLTEAV